MIGQHPHRRLQDIHLHIQKICILHTVRRRQYASSLYLLFLYIRKIDCHPLSGITFLLVCPMHLDAADLTLLPNRIHLQCILFPDCTGYQRSCDDRPESRQRKGPVDGKSGYRMDILPHYLVAGHMTDHFDQLIQSLPRGGRHLYYRRLFQKCSRKLFPDLFFHQLNPLFIHKITFIKDNNTLFNSQKSQNIHMLPGLRHDALIRRDH